MAATKPNTGSTEHARSLQLVVGLGGDRSPSEEYLALLDQVPAILYIADAGEHGAWQYVNRWIEPILGFTIDEWLGDPEIWAKRIHPEDRERVLSQEGSWAAAQVASAEAIEYRMLHRDGHTVWIRDDSVLSAGPGGIPRWHGVLSDITAQKQVELELERQAAAHAAIARLGEQALRRVSIAQLLDEACLHAAQVLEVESAMVMQIGVEQDSLELRASYGWEGAKLGARRSLLGSESQIGYTLLTGTPVEIEDWDAEVRFKRSKPLAERGIRSSVCVRIEGEDSPFGIFGVLSNAPRTYSAAEINFIQALANVISDALERQRVEDAIEYRALHDPLTGLPNRVLFLDRLEQAFERVRRRRSIAAVLFIDVDHFKQVNDTLGHHAGDELLVGVATRLRESLRPTDTVARFGGDEFGLLLEEIGSERDAIATAERIAATFARPFVLEAGSHFVTASIGIALADGTELPADLLRDADAAMYRAKERGRARYELFDENMRVRAVARMRLENDLLRALDQHELRLAYQPVVSLRDESIHGVEALLRWDHPARGPIPPTEFIPVAEETGLIERIGQWVIEEACRDAARWAQARPDSRPLTVGINLSTLQLANARFPEVVAETIAAAGLAPAQLKLEITEDALLADAEVAWRGLRLLAAIGVGLVVDDFGTGHSSLTRLTSLPIDGLKVDRQFVADLGTKRSGNKMARAVISTAKALSLDVTAEGAENIEQVRELRELGCEFAQGHLFSPAVPAAGITSMLLDGARLRRTAA